MKRKTIGETPWDAVVPPKESPKPAAKSAKKSPAAFPAAPSRGSGQKERLTVHVSVEVIERAKNAVYWTPGLTLAGLAENALQKALEGLERAHGGPFDQRRAELKGGRPLK